MSSPGDDDGSPVPVKAELASSVPVDDIPMALALPAPAAPPANPRRLPPPCWSHDDTVALIDAYRDKWYTLRRGNLKANHWQEVADSVARKCPEASPPKTAVQCRHKMEKLRKRYRTEIQRANSMPVARFSSSWVHFKRMDSMEKGPQDPDKRAASGYNSDSDGVDDNDEDDDDEPENFLADGTVAQGGAFLSDGYKNGGAYAQNRKLFNRKGAAMGPPMAPSAAGGFRIRIPTGVSIAQPAPAAPPQKFYSKVNLGNSGLVAYAGSNTNTEHGGGGRVSREDAGKKREREPMEEMVAAVKLMGDGFVRMEQMKMEMAREMEAMRMETEMKRTQMILDSQQRIVEAFAKAFSDKRRKAQQQMEPQEDLPKKAPSPSDS